MADQPSLETLNEGDAELAALAKSLANDPATRTAFLRLVKHKNPGTPIPELDMEAKMQAFAKPHVDKVAALEKKMIEDTARANIANHRATLKEKGFGADDIAAIEKLMVEKQIPSHETAAEHFRMSKELATPTPASMTSTGSYEMPVDRKVVKDAGGIKKWARTEAFAAADAIKRGQIKLH